MMMVHCKCKTVPLLQHSEWESDPPNKKAPAEALKAQAAKNSNMHKGIRKGKTLAKKEGKSNKGQGLKARGKSDQGKFMTAWKVR